ncbi:MAG TPA: hypothetical protein VFQ61_25990, partial [Polyangiaceae bacterium]|nr:hypothetical protein [Polyangiaceae bacterium]
AEPSGFVAPSASNQATALAFVEARLPDGATHLSALFESLAKLTATSSDVAVVYIGDCEPTWGVVDANELRSLAARSLGRASFNPIVIGSAVDTALAQDLAQSTQGRWLRAQQPEQLTHFVQRLRAPAVRSASVTVSAAPGATVFPAGQLPLEEGQELVLLVKTPKGQDALKALAVQAAVQTASGPQTLDWLPRTPPAPTRFVAQRFGSQLIRSLERANAPKEEVVTASLSHGVMSKYTSFLVLESEEAYARYAIERKAKQDAEAPRVTGGDLNSLDANGASISLDRIQPGDPEIYIDAPRDCVSVTVVFPFGETKRARFDPEANQGRGAWMVRFLVDRETAEGVYEAQVYIVHRDGRQELRKVSYAVDHTAPTLQVQIRPVRRAPAGTFQVQVTQPGPKEQQDLRRVEIRTPDGRVQELVPVRWAEFRGTFRLAASPAGPAALRVVGIDQALNHRTVDVELP